MFKLMTPVLMLVGPRLLEGDLQRIKLRLEGE